MTGQMIFAESEQCADMRYVSGFRAPDAFLWFRVDGRAFIAVWAMEMERARLEVHPGIRILNRETLKQALGIDGPPLTAEEMAMHHLAIELISAHFGVDEWEVPSSFPFGLASQLMEHGLKLIPKRTFCPERICKNLQEKECLRQAERLAEKGLARALDILREASITDDGFVKWQGEILLAEQLRQEIDAEIVRNGGLATGTIAAPGPQAANPHALGDGPVRANEPIVMDIFPRDQSSGYFGDLTRTVVKGKASDEVRKVYGIVKHSQKMAIDMLKPGVLGHTVHFAVADYFREQGYETAIAGGVPHGFFHGLGHGVGLEIHELPRLNRSKGQVLAPGNVVTVEPGLYYPEWGGVRLENLLYITDTGSEDLTAADYQLEIP